jgi:CYTH domain-containing protein
MQKDVYLEIERKFLPANNLWKDEIDGMRPEVIKQRYLNNDPRNIVRIRKGNGAPVLTLKSSIIENAIADPLKRTEWETEIPQRIADIFLDSGGFWDVEKGEYDPGYIEKWRYCVSYKNHWYYIDVFKGKLEGLVIIEIELSDEFEEVELPYWVGEEVTNNPKYYNHNL